MEKQSHSHSRARLYVLIFFVLGVLTMIEFGASTLPSPVKLPSLLTLATIKGLLVAGIYMHQLRAVTAATIFGRFAPVSLSLT